MSTQTEAAAADAATAVTDLTYREAINAALDDAMGEDAAVLLMGEDVSADGGVFKTNIGLADKYGLERVRNTPICENGFLNVAIGMSLVGMRPIVEIMFADFLPTAGDAIVNQLPKYRYMSGGQTTVPVTVRAIGGATGRFGTQHSATGESWFMHLPGMRVVTASSPVLPFTSIGVPVAMVPAFVNVTLPVAAVPTSTVPSWAFAAMAVRRAMPEPVPDRASGGGLPPGAALTASVAAVPPARVGEKRTVIAQLAAGASVVVPETQSPVAGEPRLNPEPAGALSDTVTAPEACWPALVTVNFLVAPSPTCTVPKSVEAWPSGASVSAAGAGAVPLSDAAVAPPGLALTRKLPALLPELVGRKATATGQLAPAASVLIPMHPFAVRTNSFGSLPASMAASAVPIPAGDPPVFFTVNVCAALVAPGAVAGKS